MTETAVRKQVTHRWYTRPVLFVADGLDELRREIVERSVPSKKSWWATMWSRSSIRMAMSCCFPFPS